MTSLAITLAVSFVQPLWAERDTFESNRTRIEFETLAGQIRYVPIHSILNNRPFRLYHTPDPLDARRNETRDHVPGPGRVPNSEVPPNGDGQSGFLARAMDRTHPAAALRILLTHHAPKVRTLAALALFNRDDPFVLPALVELCDDSAPSFEMLDETHLPCAPVALMTAETRPRLPLQPQTVGGIVRTLVGTYMNASGFYYGIAHRTEPGFAEYWNARKHRKHCAGWFSVRLARAGQATMPVPENRLAAVRALREDIDRLPSDERTWVLLWLNGDFGSDVLVSETELIEMCKSLGSDKLLLMLQDRIPSSDPDLQPRAANNLPYQQMMIFVVRHAHALFDDGDALLACEH